MGKISEPTEKKSQSFEPIKKYHPPGVPGAVQKTLGPDHPEQTAAEEKSLRVEGDSGKWDNRLVRAVNFSGEVAESFRVLRSKILRPQDGSNAAKTIMVASVLPREGKSFVVANLGVALAQCVDQYALLVDCDLRIPTLAKLLGMSQSRGLVDYLKNKTDISTLIRKTSMDKLSILASGVPPANPAELLGSARMHELVDELSSRYPDRFVIFDSPPLRVASEAMILAQAVDGVVLVVRHGVSSRALIEQAIVDIGKQKIIGVVFNGHESNFVTSRLINKNYAYYGDYYRKKAQ